MEVLLLSWSQRLLTKYLHSHFHFNRLWHFNTFLQSLETKQLATDSGSLRNDWGYNLQCSKIHLHLVENFIFTSFGPKHVGRRKKNTKKYLFSSHWLHSNQQNKIKVKWWYHTTQHQMYFKSLQRKSSKMLNVYANSDP